jgi:TRAP-type C4-dicarboxylate transport system substrate-binding protein
MSFYEVQDYMIQAKQAQFITTLVAAQDFYSNLPEEQRQMVDEVTDNMRSYIFEKQAQFNEERLNTIKENSDIQVSTLTDEQRNAFREKSMSVRDTFIEQAGDRGKQILETLQQDIEAAEKQKSGS